MGRVIAIAPLIPIKEDWKCPWKRGLCSSYSPPVSVRATSNPTRARSRARIVTRPNWSVPVNGGIVWKCRIGLFRRRAICSCMREVMLKLTMDYKMTKQVPMLDSCTLKESRTWLLVCTRHCYFIPFNHEHPVGKMWWVVSQIWLNSDSNELSQSWVRLVNLGFELSRSWVRLGNLGFELSRSWVTWIVIWVRVESARKNESSTTLLGNYWADWDEIWYIAWYVIASRGAHLKLRVPLHVRTCAPLFSISETTGPIGLKFCTQSGIPQLVMVHTLNFRCLCTCARAHPFFVSRKLLGRLSWNLELYPLSCIVPISCTVHSYVYIWCISSDPTNADYLCIQL